MGCFRIVPFVQNPPDPSTGYTGTVARSSIQIGNVAIVNENDYRTDNRRMT